VEHAGLAPHAPYTASANLYRSAEEVARRRNFLLTTHLAESLEETLMFRDRSGPLYEFLNAIGREMSDCGGHTPVETFCKMRDSSTSLGMTNDWMLVHLNEVSENDLRLLAPSISNISIGHCPRSHKYFGHSRFPFEKLRDLGFNICLGTDSLASNCDLSLFAEMRALQELESAFSPEEILKMVTVNSARALHFADKIGQIRPGLLADMIAIPFNQSPKNVFTEIVAFEKSISWMMIAGEVATP
jgi:cytosine/adenosine deaminase-related metal-dependent hydrolase